METAHLNAAPIEPPADKPACCAECGWPGLGALPVGVRVTDEDGKRTLIGKLSYVQITSVLCSVCLEMKAAIENNPWFVEAHSEYLSQVEAKRRLLFGPGK